MVSILSVQGALCFLALVVATAAHISRIRPLRSWVAEDRGGFQRVMHKAHVLGARLPTQLAAGFAVLAASLFIVDI